MACVSRSSACEVVARVCAGARTRMTIRRHLWRQAPSARSRQKGVAQVSQAAAAAACKLQPRGNPVREDHLRTEAFDDERDDSTRELVIRGRQRPRVAVWCSETRNGPAHADPIEAQVHSELQPRAQRGGVREAMLRLRDNKMPRRSAARDERLQRRCCAL